MASLLSDRLVEHRLDDIVDGSIGIDDFGAEGPIDSGRLASPLDNGFELGWVLPVPIVRASAEARRSSTSSSTTRQITLSKRSQTSLSFSTVPHWKIVRPRAAA